MCITFGPAHLSSTLLYAAEVFHDGRTVHVLGYQNSVENRASGPNAMILPFPSAEPMTSANILDTSGCPKILKDYADTLVSRRRSRSFSDSDGLLSKGVQVFDSGHYTVVLADKPTEIPRALGLVPKARRPEPNANVLAAFEQIYPGWPLALCCFDSGEMPKPDPLLWWYVPKRKDLLFLPALDAHDGNAPRLDAQVQVDHTIMVGSHEGCRGGSPVRFKDDIPEKVQPFLVDQITGLNGRGDATLKPAPNNGAGVVGKALNGDFVVPIIDVQTKVSLSADDYRVSPRHGHAA